MTVTYADLIQIGILVVGIIGLFIAVDKKRLKSANGVISYNGLQAQQTLAGQVMV